MMKLLTIKLFHFRKNVEAISTQISKHLSDRAQRLCEPDNSRKIFRSPPKTRPNRRSKRTKPPSASRAVPDRANIRKLQLNEQQKVEVQNIFSNVRTEMQAIRQENAPQMQEVRTRANENLQKVLTTEQWQQFQQIRSESSERRRGEG